MNPDSRPLPVTILSGFLGAGKTTLLRHLMRSMDPRRVAILENELGSIAIDDTLLEAVAPGRLDVVFGRSCCEAREAFLHQLYAVASVAASFDRLIIETTGVAHPGMLAQLMSMDSALRHRLKLDGIVTVIDAANYLAHVERDGHATEQVAYADALIVNKTDLIAVEAIDPLLLALRSVNGQARCFVTRNGRAPADELLNLGGFDFARIEQGVSGCRETDAATPHPQGQHQHEIETVALTSSGDLNAERFLRWIEAFIVDHAPDLYRAKGVVALAGLDERVVFQGVHGSFASTRERPWGDTEARTSRFVFIGRNLAPAQIKKQIENCRAACHTPPTAAPVAAAPVGRP